MIKPICHHYHHYSSQFWMPLSTVSPQADRLRRLRHQLCSCLQATESLEVLKGARSCMCGCMYICNVCIYIYMYTYYIYIYIHIYIYLMYVYIILYNTCVCVYTLTNMYVYLSNVYIHSVCNSVYYPISLSFSCLNTSLHLGKSRSAQPSTGPGLRLPWDRQQALGITLSPG